MSIYEMTTDTASATFDRETRIVHIRYHGVLNAESSGAVYAWLQVLFMEEGIGTIYGEIFDFRQVTHFQPDNLMNARQKSRTINFKMDTSRLPIAMIVNDDTQEATLRNPMRNIPENPRKRIVHTPKAARAFLDEWHAINEQEQAS